MTRSGAFLYRCFIAALLCISPGILLADAGIDNTQGPGSYQDSVFNIDANISKQVNIGAGYEQTASSSSASMDPAKTYSGNLNIKAGENYTIGLNVNRTLLRLTTPNRLAGSQRLIQQRKQQNPEKNSQAVTSHGSENDPMPGYPRVKTRNPKISRGDVRWSIIRMICRN